MNAPLILAVDDDPDLLAAVERELRSRYAADYRICPLGTPAEALAVLEASTTGGADVALVLAAEDLAGAPGTE
jgi:thioredoxin reductase (NADPH)